MDNATKIKLIASLVLFGTWVALVVFKVPGSDDLIAAIKIGLSGIGAHTLTMVVPGQVSTQPSTPTQPTTEQVTK